MLITEADEGGFGAPEKSVHDCSIGDYYLARHPLDTTEYCGYGSVLAVNDGVLTTFNACDDYGRKLDQSKFSTMCLTFAAPRRPISR